MLRNHIEFQHTFIANINFRQVKGDQHDENVSRIYFHATQT